MKREEELKRPSYGWRALRSFLQGTSGIVFTVLGVKSFFDKEDNEYLGACAVALGSINAYYGIKNFYKYATKEAMANRKYETYDGWLYTLML